ncbi:MAG: 16S rRNA (cytidine(1402)-2'-O)-methyltransferase [Pseudomonadota bacterium]
MSNRPSTLYIVATPIGNLGDMTPRALEVLAAADLVAAEDTRHSRQLLNHFGVSAELLSLHEHNERERCQAIIERLSQGQSVALISDAGTPAISDPGFVLVRAVREAGFAVISVPGPCALIAALSIAGLATDRFVFDGFLPPKPRGRREAYGRYLDEPRTAVLYESSHRILDSLSDLCQVLGGERIIAVARELTKLYETVLSGTAQSVHAAVAADGNQRRGEFVIIIQGADEQPAGRADLAAVLRPLSRELPPRKAAAVAAEITGCRKSEAYDLLLSLKSDDQGDN